MDSTADNSRFSGALISVIFLLALFIPLLSWLFQEDQPYSSAEKRELLPLSGVISQGSLTDRSHAFDQYYQDHFGFREWLIHRYQREVNKRFGGTGVADVVEGEENWLFFSNDRLLEDRAGSLHFSAKEEELLWQKLQEKKKWYGEHGIAYLFLLIPNKQSIYPEYLPPALQQQRGETRLDHLLSRQPPEAAGILLDIRPQLLEGKDGGRLYDKSDTHWNQRGALLAHQAVVQQTRQLFADYRGRSKFRFKRGLKYLPGGDLAVMIGRSKAMPEGRPPLDSADFSASFLPIPPALAAIPGLSDLESQYSKNPTAQLRLLVFHDSFFEQLQQFTSEGYGEVLYLWKGYDFKGLETLMERYQPDLVIDEIVERHLHRFLQPSGEE